MIDETVSHYRITRQLGAGGMGVVYEAVDTRLDRTVALKFLPPESTRDPEAKARFIHEAKAASALDHPNVCTVHEIGETDDGRLFLAMACYEGETLRGRIDRGPLPLAEALDIARQIAEGLAKAHGQRIVHRDIKPANVFVTADGLVKILDFGLAKLAGQTRVTRTGTTLGTVAYMSPEQARGEETDARTDLWSLGVLLYEMVAGRPPFRGEHQAAVVYALQNSDPEPVTALRTGVPLELERIIGKCLAKDARERYQTAAGLLSDLLPLGNSLDRGASGKRTPTRIRKRRGRRWPLAAAVALLVVAVGIVGWMALRSGNDRDSTEPSLAIVDFRDMASEADPVVSASLTELLSTALIEASPVRIQSPEYLRDIRRRLFGGPDMPVAGGQELEIAREGGATYLLTGRLGVLEGERFVTWRLVDVGSGRSVGAGRAEPGKMSAMVDGIVEGVLVLFAEATGAAPTTAPIPVERITTVSATAYEHYVLGRLRYAENRPEAALREFKQAVERDSTFALAHLAMARLYFGDRTVVLDIALARRHASAAWRHEDRLGARDRLHLKAFQHGLDYEVRLELAAYREILERWPDSRETLRLMEERSYWWWEFEETIATARQGLEIYPDDQDIGGAAYAQALRQRARYEQSCRVAQRCVARFPANPGFWDELARSYLSLGRPDSAGMAFARAFTIDPGWYPWCFATCAYHAGDVDSAIAICEALLTDEGLPSGRRLEIMYGFTHNLHLPALYYEAGRYRDAIRIIEEAGRLVGDDPSYWQYQAGEVLTAVGLPDRALEIAAEMERSDEIRVRIFALRFKGLAQAAAGDLAAARVTAARAHEWAETVGAMLSYCGYKIEASIALAEGDPTAALAALAKLSEIGQVFGGMLHIEDRTMLARAHRMAGNLEDAATVHREMLRIYGGHALSHYELGGIYEEMGRPREAEAEYTAFLEMWSNADEGLPPLDDARARLAGLKARSR